MLRAYPNNPLYCGRLQSPMPALSAKNVLNVEKTTPPSIFGLPPWPVIRISSKTIALHSKGYFRITR
jgi:hypothetical protein